jgi:cysteine synthase
MLTAIGDTPLVRLRRVVHGGSGEVWVKIEGGNPTGSYKDRMALAMVRGAERDGVLDGKVRLLECTGGSTGSSLAFVCAVLGHPLTVISSDAYAREKLDSMRALGAELVVVPSRGGKVTPDLWPRMRALARRMSDTGSHHWLDQFHNPHAAKGYGSMGRELVRQAPARIDAFCGAVGTAGMITGVGRVLRGAFPNIRLVAVEPASSAVLSGGVAGTHGIDGTGAGFVPPLFDASLVTEVRACPEGAARAMARRLASQEGLFAGTSTGLNVTVALELAAELGPDSVVATVACDSGFKYLDGPLFRAR